MSWIRRDRVTWAERGLWTALVAAAIAPVALQPDAEEVARAYVAAVDRGNVEAAVALTAERFVLNPDLDRRLLGMPEARGVLEWRAALHERWRTVSWRYNPTQREVHTEVEITNDAWELIDCRPVVEVVLVIRNGELIVEQARIESNELRRSLAPFLEWAADERPAELDRVWTEYGPRWDTASAERLLALLEEWRAVRPGVAERPARGQG
ncbi:MAG TPA: hypothetical protein VFM44_07300 [Gemmatimonadota bacterium]|nr:hypothetical protein [Gemmatimonadota bacterium]